MRLRYAVIVTRDRPGDFEDCVAMIAPQVHAIVVVAHMDPPYVRDTLLQHGMAWQVISYNEDPPNISRMWNLGLEAAAVAAPGRRPPPHDVAILNDDVVVPPDWFDRVASEMWTNGSTAGCVARPDDPRMTGYAFVLNGDADLRADEQFQWWYGDDDLQKQAERLGGVAFAPGPGVEHRHPNSTTVGVLAEIAAEDSRRYTRKWYAL